MPVKVTYDPRSVASVQAFLKAIPPGAIHVVMPALTDYVLGVEQGDTGGNAPHGLKHYPPFVAWPGGQQFPKRTGYLQRGWEGKGTPYRPVISNAVPYATYVMGDRQTWRARYGNWRQVGEVVQSNLAGAFRWAIGKLNAWLRTKNK